ncbi:hypothetical protein [Caballeronia cordobensis]|uniref:hypothetical protein n=1 Tax=Caballeronia cordobensis TaxID=1353886 RepID=UPI00158DC3D5
MQDSLSTDAKTAAGAVSDAAALGQTPSMGIGIIDGQTSITNSQGPVLSALTGVAATDGTQNDTFTSLADEAGHYDLLVPAGVPGLDYSDFSVLAYDPVAGKVLATKGQSLTGLNPGGTLNGPTLSGVCTDLDASNPDSDDPDCD